MSNYDFSISEEVGNKVEDLIDWDIACALNCDVKALVRRVVSRRVNNNTEWMIRHEIEDSLMEEYDG